MQQDGESTTFRSNLGGGQNIPTFINQTRSVSALGVWRHRWNPYVFQLPGSPGFNSVINLTPKELWLTIMRDLVEKMVGRCQCQSYNSRITSWFLSREGSDLERLVPRGVRSAHLSICLGSSCTLDILDVVLVFVFFCLCVFVWVCCFIIVHSSWICLRWCCTFYHGNSLWRILIWVICLNTLFNQFNPTFVAL